MYEFLQDFTKAAYCTAKEVWIGVGQVTGLKDIWGV
jgi:hypothetical protein